MSTKMSQADHRAITTTNRKALQWHSGNDMAWMRDYSRMTVNAYTGIAEYEWTTCDENENLIQFKLTVDLKDEQGNCTRLSAYRAIFKAFVTRGIEYATTAQESSDSDKRWHYAQQAEDMAVFAQFFDEAAYFELGAEADEDGIGTKLGDAIDKLNEPCAA